MSRLLPVVLSLIPALAHGAEGMWTFDNFPAARVRQELAVEVTPAWLDRVRLATARLEGGCSGSFVSADGLVLTNHHCITGCLRELSTADQDLSANGYLARRREDERRCSSEQVSVLTRIEDVTGKVRAAVGATAGADASRRRKAALTNLEQACERAYPARDPRACEAVTLYGGGQYFLYHYRRYDDVRLVLAPEYAVAFFGGDPDNFQFPRYNLDFALLRVYANGRPARTPQFHRVRAGGAAAGEAVFVPGHPGQTDRLRTVAELEFLRSVAEPRWLLRAAELRGRYARFADESPENARIVNEPRFYLENALKARRYGLEALLDPALLAARQRDEDALRAAIATRPELSGAGRAYADIDRALASQRTLFDPYTFVERGAGFGGELMAYARTLVRGAAERQRPNAERLREFTDAALPKRRQALLAATPIYPDLEVLRLQFGFEKLQEHLGPDDPLVRRLFADESPAALAARLVAGSQLADPKVREALWDGGPDAVAASTDPLMVLARAMEPDARRIRQRYEDEVESVLDAAGEEIAAARFAILGTGTYPDATFTLRLAWGTVAGWREGDADVPPFTMLGGLFTRATGTPPFALPARWLAARDRLDASTPLNFSSTVDIIGGNSGSAVIDAAGRLVGLIFDGNIHSLGGDYWFDAGKNRAVAVHPAAILEAMEQVMDAKSLVRELTVER
jgi:hypothetical protein